MSNLVKLAILTAVLVGFSLSFEAQNMAAPLGWYVPGSSVFHSGPAGHSLRDRSDGGEVAKSGAVMAPVSEF